MTPWPRQRGRRQRLTGTSEMRAGALNQNERRDIDAQLIVVHADHPMLGGVLVPPTMHAQFSRGETHGAERQQHGVCGQVAGLAQSIRQLAQVDPPSRISPRINESDEKVDDSLVIYGWNVHNKGDLDTIETDLRWGVLLLQAVSEHCSAPGHLVVQHATSCGYLHSAVVFTDEGPRFGGGAHRAPCLGWKS